MDGGATTKVVRLHKLRRPALHDDVCVDTPTSSTAAGVGLMRPTRRKGDMRIAVEHILAMLAAGDTPETVLAEYPALDAEDVRACLLFAHRAVGEHIHDRAPVRAAS